MIKFEEIGKLIQFLFQVFVTGKEDKDEFERQVIL